jgi:hypothetical protein
VAQNRTATAVINSAGDSENPAENAGVGEDAATGCFVGLKVSFVLVGEREGDLVVLVKGAFVRIVGVIVRTVGA